MSLYERGEIRVRRGQHVELPETAEDWYDAFGYDVEVPDPSQPGGWLCVPLQAVPYAVACDGYEQPQVVYDYLRECFPRVDPDQFALLVDWAVDVARLARVVEEAAREVIRLYEAGASDEDLLAALEYLEDVESRSGGTPVFDELCAQLIEPVEPDVEPVEPEEVPA